MSGGGTELGLGFTLALGHLEEVRDGEVPRLWTPYSEGKMVSMQLF